MLTSSHDFYRNVITDNDGNPKYDFMMENFCMVDTLQKRIAFTRSRQVPPGSFSVDTSITDLSLSPIRMHEIHEQRKVSYEMVFDVQNATVNTTRQGVTTTKNYPMSSGYFEDNMIEYIFGCLQLQKGIIYTLSGMELATLLPSSTKIVFTTAYANYAVESFNFQTIDYLLKPITLKRFLAAIAKIEASFQPLINGNTSEDQTFFFFKSGKVLKRILLKDILYFEGEQEYVRVATTTVQFLIYRRLKELQEQLSTPFVRVHNSYIVNMRHIDKIEGNHVYIGNKHLSISDKCRTAFMQVIDQRTF